MTVTLPFLASQLTHARELRAWGRHRRRRFSHLCTALQRHNCRLGRRPIWPINRAGLSHELPGCQFRLLPRFGPCPALPLERSIERRGIDRGMDRRRHVAVRPHTFRPIHGHARLQPSLYEREHDGPSPLFPRATVSDRSSGYSVPNGVTWRSRWHAHGFCFVLTRRFACPPGGTLGHDSKHFPD